MGISINTKIQNIDFTELMELMSSGKRFSKAYDDLKERSDKAVASELSLKGTQDKLAKAISAFNDYKHDTEDELDKATNEYNSMLKEAGENLVVSQKELEDKAESLILWEAELKKASSVVTEDKKLVANDKVKLEADKKAFDKMVAPKEEALKKEILKAAVMMDKAQKLDKEATKKIEAMKALVG